MRKKPVPLRVREELIDFYAQAGSPYKGILMAIDGYYELYCMCMQELHGHFSEQQLAILFERVDVIRPRRELLRLLPELPLRKLNNYQLYFLQVAALMAGCPNALQLELNG